MGRRLPFASLFLLFALVAASAQAQRFANLASASDDRSPAARAAGTPIVVDVDLVRSRPERLELTAPDGRILVAERSMFEDRGAGNVMWSGGFAGAGYDSVMLTVQDGYMQGRFGEPESAAYWIRAGVDGVGRMTQPVGGTASSSSPFCGGGLVPDDQEPLAAIQAQRSDPPVGVRSESNHDRLDILVLYTAGAAEVWEALGYGTPRASVQASMDYMSLVFRNNAMPVTPHLIHLAEAPAALDGSSRVVQRLSENRVSAELRAEYQADIVHLFTGEEGSTLGYCGIAYVLTRQGERDDFSNANGVTSAACAFPAQEGAYPYFGRVFAHEIGHNLGANHDPPHAGIDRDVAVRPWAFGHADITTAPTVETIMSYLNYSPRRWEPFFSSVRISPNGWTIGVQDQRENERALYDTLPLAAQYSDNMPDPAGFDETHDWLPGAPGSLTVKPTSKTSARLEWKNQSDNEEDFRIQARTAGDIWRVVKTEAAGSEASEVTGLKSGGRYMFRVRAHRSQGAADSETVTATLTADGGSGPGPGDIDIPADVTAAAFGPTSVALTWGGASKGTVEIEARTWKAGWSQVITADATAGSVTVADLEAEAPYTFRLRTRAGSGKTSAWSDEVSATTGDAAGACRSGGRFLCLSEGRFEIQAHWKDHNREGVYGNGTAVPIDVSDESGMFWFFSSTNIELVVKALDGRGLNGHYWVFFGALSDAEYWVTVRDTVGGGGRTYHNPPAENCGQSDITAFLPSGAVASGSSGGGGAGTRYRSGTDDGGGDRSSGCRPGTGEWHLRTGCQPALPARRPVLGGRRVHRSQRHAVEGRRGRVVPYDEGNRFLLVLQSLQCGTRGQGAGRPGADREVLVPLRRSVGRGVHDHAD